MSVDVTFNNVSPSSARTVLWLEMYPALKTIYLVSRYVLQTVRFEARPRLTITVPNRGGLASYSLVCLIAHFMQVRIEGTSCAEVFHNGWFPSTKRIACQCSRMHLVTPPIFWWKCCDSMQTLTTVTLVSPSVTITVISQRYEFTLLDSTAMLSLATD